MGGVQYVRSADGAQIAFIVHGSGPETPVVSMRPPQFSHLEREWEMPFSHHEYSEWGHARAVIRYDPRGTGMSERGVADQSLEARVADLGAVLDGAGAGTVILDSVSSSSLPALAFAAHAPERVEKLITQNACAHGHRWWGEPNRQALLALATIEWTVCTETWAWMTWASADSRANLQLAEHIRACITPEDFVRMAEAERLMDLRPLLGLVRMPTLVLSHPHFARMVPTAIVHDLAHALPASQLVEIASTRERVQVVDQFIHGMEVTHPLQGAPPVARSEAGHGLSEREREVLVMVAKGLTNREIAEALVVSVRTVDSHVANAYRKAGLNGRAAATAFAIRNGLL